MPHPTGPEVPLTVAQRAAGVAVLFAAGGVGAVGLAAVLGVAVRVFRWAAGV